MVDANRRPLILLSLLLGLAFHCAFHPVCQYHQHQFRRTTRTRRHNGALCKEHDRDREVDENKAFDTARFLLQRVISSLLMEPQDVWSWSQQPMLEPPIYKAVKAAAAKAHRKLVHDILTQASEATAAADDDAITTSTVYHLNSAEMNLVKNRGVASSFIRDNEKNDNGDDSDSDDEETDCRGASTYGEVTELGVR
jgi:hypothetical protein